MRGIMLLLVVVLSGPPLYAQSVRVTGRVTDPDGSPVVGVRVEEPGTGYQTSTRADGSYALQVSSGTAALRFTRIGYRMVERALDGATTLDVVMEPAAHVVEAIEVVGTRRANRSELETPVPVDVIDIAQLSATAAEMDVNQVLHNVAPSFNANRQSGADGADHVDPATLRGLGPDQTLVLINGKRRHQSSLINIFGSRGRGNTGTDLNAIPLSAIERVEILRDGASAQYGSDAIAGVINIVLKSDVDELDATIASGFHSARPSSDLPVLRTTSVDGEQVQVGANYGIPVGQRGFVNLTAEYLTKEQTNRPADPAVFDIYRRQFGDAGLDNFSGFVNSRIQIG